MARLTVVIFAFATLGVSTPLAAQDRQDRQDRRRPQEVARAQGLPPGQLPPSNMCRVWYDNRSSGHQPRATNCREAQLIASRDRNARVIYGEAVYGAYANGNGRDHRDLDMWDREDEDRAVSRPGRARDPRSAPGWRNASTSRTHQRYVTPAFQSGYRDGLSKGREDADDRDRYDPNRHSWYRSATRGYEDEYGRKADYQVRYREGFNAGYAENYRAFSRR